MGHLAEARTRAECQNGHLRVSQKLAKISHKWLCHATTSPPCCKWLHDDLELRGSRVMLGQRGQREPPDVSRHNHHLRATWHSVEFRCKSRPVEGIAEIQEPA